jgi:zinc protease
VGDLPVFERTLANGLKALVLPRPGAPVVVCDLYYPVGSVDEPPGRSGLAHFVEHMLFKGTERFPKGQIDRLAFAAAGQANAETAEDLTHYWFAFPADRWPLALAVEADRMRNATFDEAEVEAERRVIVEERARELDSPLGRLDQMHLTVSYLVHPYRNPILGWPEDLRRLDAADLRAFYALHYRPEGAVLVVVGAVEPGRVLDRIAAEFEALPRGPIERPGPPPPEPKQIGRRDFALLESDGVARGLLGWRTVPLGHPDTPALDVLSDLLTCGRRSRLWEHLVERRRAATWIDAAQEGARLSGQFLIQLEAAPGVEAPRVEAEVRAVLDRLAAEGPTAAELARSRRRLEAAWRWEQEDLGGLAAGLGQVALWDDWRAWQGQHRAALAVTADDIRRVASTYLVDSALTAGWSLPRPARGVVVAGRDGDAKRPGPATSRGGPLAWPIGPEDAAAGPTVPLVVPGRAPSVAPYRPTRTVLPNGLRVLTERRPGTGTVALEAYVDAGVFREAKPGLAYLTGRMREEGTTTRTADAVAEAIEDVGGTLEIGATGASVRVNAEDLPLAVELLADVLIRPAFPAENFLWARRRIAAELRADRDDPAFRADLLFRSVVYGDHPYGRDVRGGARQLAGLGLDDVRAHHERFFTPENAFLVAVGDFEPRELRALLRRNLAPWHGLGSPLPTPERPSRASRPRLRRVSHEGAQVHILLGHLGVARDDPDYDALVVLDHILGSGPGFADRLSRTLRDELGLAYTVGGGMTDSADLAPGLFRIYIGTGPDEADRAVAAALEQIRAVHRGAFDDEEVDRARRYLAGAWVFDYQTVGQRAERLLELERWSLPLDEPLRWPERIARVTPRQVRQAARRHIDPAALVRVEYGPTSAPRRRARADCA